MLLIEIGAELSAKYVGTMLSVPYQRAGMEGFNAVGTSVILQKLICGFRDPGVPFFHLDFHDQWNPSVHHLQKFLKGGDSFPCIRFACSAQRKLFQFRQRQITNPSVYAAHARERIVMEHDGDAVGGKLHVKLDSIALFHSEEEGLHGVFRDSRLQIMKTPVRIIISHERSAVRAVKPGNEQQKIQGRKKEDQRGEKQQWK